MKDKKNKAVESDSSDKTMDELKKIFNDMFVSDLLNAGDEVKQTVLNNVDQFNEFKSETEKENKRLQRFIKEELGKTIELQISSQFDQLKKDNDKRDEELNSAINLIFRELKRNRIINIVLSSIVIAFMLVLIVLFLN